MKQDVESIDRSYRPDIDGLRAIAIVSVVLYHAGVPHLGGGFTGVDIFFVISGYLIGGHIYSELRAGTFTFLQFYRRRAKRILPAFYVVLAFTIVMALLMLSPSEASDFARSAFAATLSASNIFFERNTSYFNPTSEFSPLLMTWSLGVEEQFYAVIPLLMVLLVRIRNSLLLPAVLSMSVISFLFSWSELSKNPEFAFFMLPTRAWELGIGVALAIAELNRKRSGIPRVLAQILSATGIVLMLAPIFLLSKFIPFPGPAALPSVFGTAFILMAPVGWLNRKILSFPLLVFIGRISYSWYLWHWPILTFLRIVSGSELSRAVAFGAIAVSLAAAVISYRFIEQPLRRSNLAPVPLLLRYGAVTLLMLAVCMGFRKIAPALSPKPSGVEDAVSSAMAHTHCLAFHDEMNLSPPCYDPSGNRPSVALWGDSHSDALAPALRSIASTGGFGFVQLGHSACLPLAGAAVYQPTDPLNARRCMILNRKALEILETDRRIRYVVLTGRWADAFPRDFRSQWLITDPDRHQDASDPDTSNAIFVRSLEATVKGLVNAGKQVIVFEDVPNFDFDPVLRVRTSSRPLRHALAVLIGTTDSGFGPAANETSVAVADAQLKIALSDFPKAALIDLRPSFCRNSNQCMYRDGDRIFYLDSQHLTATGAFYALRDFKLPDIDSK